MNAAYIALIDFRGLRILVREDGQQPSEQFRTVARLSHPNCVLLWALLPTDAVQLIRRSLQSGDARRALRILEHRAERVGTIHSPDLCEAA